MSQYQNRARGNYRGNNYRGNFRGNSRGNSRGNYRGRARGNSRGKSYNNFREERENNSDDEMSDNDNSENNDDYDDESSNNESSNNESSNNENSNNQDENYSNNDNYDNEEEEDENNTEDDDDELGKGENQYEREMRETGHSGAADKNYRSLDHTPARSIINSNYRSKEVQPFIDSYITSYNNNSFDLTEFYTDDAVFSLTFKKVPRDSEFSMLFVDNRNLFFHPKALPIVGGGEILNFIKTKFRQGSNMTETKRNIQVVSNVLFAVNIYGTINIYKDDDSMKTVNFAKSLVVIGRNGKLLIANDHLALCV